MTRVEDFRESVVIPKLRDQQRIVSHLVNHAVFIGEAA